MLPRDCQTWCAAALWVPRPVLSERVWVLWQVDVEGMELEVLRGVGAPTWPHICQVAAEVWLRSTVQFHHALHPPRQ